MANFAKILRIPDRMYRVLRMIIVTLFFGAVGLYAILYVTMSLPFVQNYARQVGEKELSKLLDSDVHIGHVSVSPFNQLTAGDVALLTHSGDTIAHIDELGAGISIYRLLRDKRFVFTYAEVLGLDARINKATKDSPLNIQPIIDALSPKDKTKPPTKFDLKFYNVVIRRSRLAYDVLNEPYKAGKFDANHVLVENITADVFLPRIKNDDFDIEIKRLAMREKCGFELKKLVGHTTITSTQLTLKDFAIELPNSYIHPEDITLNYNSLKTLGKDIMAREQSLLLANSYITPSDFKGFVPLLESFNEKLNITLSAKGMLSDLKIPVLNLVSEKGGINISLTGDIKGLPKADNLNLDLPHIRVEAHAGEIAKIINSIPTISPKASSIIRSCGDVMLDAYIAGTSHDITFDGEVSTALGGIVANAQYVNTNGNKTHHITGHVQSQDINIGALLGNADNIANAGFELEGDVRITGKQVNGDLSGNISHATIKGYTYNDIDLAATIDGSHYNGSLNINDPNIVLNVQGDAHINGAASHIVASIDASNINFNELRLSSQNADKNLSFSMNADISHISPEKILGNIEVTNLAYQNSIGNGVKINHIDINALENEQDKEITILSDVFDGSIKGEYDFRTLVPALKRMVGDVLPSLLPKLADKSIATGNNFDFNFVLRNDEELLSFLKVKQRPLTDITISGNVNSKDALANLTLSAPYIQNGNKLIENTSLDVKIDGLAKQANIVVGTKMPSKRGDVELSAKIDALDDVINSKVSFDIDNPHKFQGDLDITSKLAINHDTKKMLGKIDINESRIVLNDTTWVMHPSHIAINGKEIAVDGFEFSHGKQHLKIDGKISENPDDCAVVDLSEVDLDFVFEALNIPNVTFCGIATGTFYASNVFDMKNIKLNTPCLHVDDFGYNHTVLGNTDIKSQWDPETKGITLNADINQANKRHAYVDGAIYPTMDSLYLDIKVDHTNVAFLQPFMSAFCSDLKGQASGKGTLFGNFKTINFMGDIFADELTMKIDYLNTYYSCSDSVHIKPDLIMLDNITLHDKYGHTAMLNGKITHNAFHDACLDLKITDAKDFLCYDITPVINSKWYGTIFGNGAAFITGEPGWINIDVDMQTADNSTFSFVIDDHAAAGEYNFITIVDRNRTEEPKLDALTEEINRLKNKVNNSSSTPTAVNINLQVEATPQAQMNLIMDPVGGDKIRARGSGNLKLTYNSVDDAMALLGKYTLEKGTYNFTLQDIIIKDFTIMEGSAISFNGDPMNAQLNITASYKVNASLTDLDESFALDKEMNRTNVPVQALLYVKGDMSEPEISFDLAFPTLTQEAYSKVKSIISTDDMMSRQIIYLVALNKFYTPEYMGNRQQNSEFANVASSTISSQLSNILGSISDKWSIAPNLRTNKGDFSDVEVDVALSSSLLNNRLLLNGNFGYRDKSLNANSSNFIGDFDIEYLLTRSGTVRLKAYNHFNDQNFYVKNALTTQGVGIVFKNDFDKFFDFLQRSKKKTKLAMPTDTVVATPTDTISTQK